MDGANGGDQSRPEADWRQRMAGPDGPPLYILITQCLQNDFFYNKNSQLMLPDAAARKLLVHQEKNTQFIENGGRRSLPGDTVKNGPLGRFLDLTVGQRLGGKQGKGVLHLINIRDWHEVSDHYDLERRYYGTHCEAGTWGAEYVTELQGVLDPDGKQSRAGRPAGADFPAEGQAVNDRLVIHHIRANTLFDLQRALIVPEPGDGQPRTAVDAEFRCSDLERVLDPLFKEYGDRIRIVVVGVYTDIKVQILLQSLRVAYSPKRLVVSDSLTASPSLERHLAALDFAQKVLWVDVVHGITDLVRFLGNEPDDRAARDLETATNEIVFADYYRYFFDKQTILSYETEQHRRYKNDVGDRLNRTVRWIHTVNYFLLIFGALTLLSSVGLALFTAFYRPSPGQPAVPVAIPICALGVSVTQIIAYFFTRPLNALTATLGDETVFRMLLESRSLRLALARHYLTSPAVLTTPSVLTAADGKKINAHANAVTKATESLTAQLQALEALDEIDFNRLARFGGTGVEPRRRGGPRRGPVPRRHPAAPATGAQETEPPAPD